MFDRYKVFCDVGFVGFVFICFVPVSLLWFVAFPPVIDIEVVNRNDMKLTTTCL